MNVTLRLLLNLSFDPGLCQEIVREAFLPKLTALLGSVYCLSLNELTVCVRMCLCAGNESHDKVVLCILYHISFDRRSRAVFAYTDCIPKVLYTHTSTHTLFAAFIHISYVVYHHSVCMQLMKILLECPENRLESEVIALG